MQLIRPMIRQQAVKILAWIFLAWMPASIVAQEIGTWEEVYTDDGTTQTRRLYLTPAEQPKSAFQLRFYPRSKESRTGNAAIHYLKAGGFFERTRIRIAIEEFREKQRNKAKQEGLDWAETAPNVWLSMPSSEIPITELKNYLQLLDFQSSMMTTASKRQNCDFDRKIEQEENVYEILLPAVQEMRQLALNQSLRFKLAIAEGRTEDATRIFGEQLMLGHHIGQDDFLVSGLVGIACAGIGIMDSYDLCETENSQNVYWALADFPNPVVDVDKLIETEFETFNLMIPTLSEIGITQRQDGECKQCAQELVSFIEYFITNSQDDTTGNLRGLSLAGLIATSYPQAKKFLIEELGYTEDELDGVSALQVTLFALAKFDNFIKDELRKSLVSRYFSLDEILEAEIKTEKLMQRYWLLSVPTNYSLPAVRQVVAAGKRTEQWIALRRAVASIRHHLATNDGSLPTTLADLELAAPADPVSRKPFDYVIDDGVAKLKTTFVSGASLAIELRVKK